MALTTLRARTTAAIAAAAARKGDERTSRDTPARKDAHKTRLETAEAESPRDKIPSDRDDLRGA